MSSIFDVLYIPEIVISSAVSGLDIAYIPEAIINNELSSGALVNVLPDHKSKPFETYLYYQNELHAPKDSVTY